MLKISWLQVAVCVILVASASACSPSETAALNSLYQATNGPNWTRNSGWVYFNTPGVPLPSFDDFDHELLRHL
jgi:hypothetical protein